MRLLQLDDLMTSYTKARPEAGLFVRLPRSSRLQLRCRGRITRHSDPGRVAWVARYETPRSLAKAGDLLMGIVSTILGMAFVAAIGAWWPISNGLEVGVGYPFRLWIE